MVTSAPDKTKCLKTIHLDWIVILINSYVTLKVILSAFIFRVVCSAKNCGQVCGVCGQMIRAYMSSMKTTKGHCYMFCLNIHDIDVCIHTHTHTYTYTYIHTCVRVCECVCVCAGKHQTNLATMVPFCPEP